MYVMIRFPNKHVNVNKLDTYQHILALWLPLQRLSQKVNGKVNQICLKVDVTIAIRTHLKISYGHEERRR